ncbi:aminotransferase-like domain-containing protein [Thalassovita mediterranea]|jgi:DNA-binding transcriptional MocR family regulator|uniref:2-aminoadipate transaminase n=1 Tax=Thalassovita mediterranea TaxID=340021 RepID=A0A0P1GLU3_9RHOB|nr:PLP-dependent aminotransferase family protein [Thalassovita mediterranea]MCG7571962.1 PLP-dependent aminotransferase family protein [Phaeobacter sp. CNT1-3]CUH83121.1 2-aminoadipate transaminase [Thalassovita mediterranea]SIS33259.1 transcriptional regulator, GntR family [Thalassovita mediterranea]
MGTNWLPDLSNAGRSKYKALANAIRDGVAVGELRSGEKLLPVRELAYQLSVTPGTVARAYSLLTEEGVLSAGVGRGTFVAETTTRSDPSHDWPLTLSLRSPLLPDMGQSELIRDAMRKTADTIGARDLLSYPTRAMDLPLRRALRRWMSDLPVGAFTAEELVLAHGAQNALLMVMQTILQGPDPVIAVEDLTYTGFRRAAALCRARVVAVRTDEEGPVVADLERLVREEGVQLFCTSSEVSNPTVRFTSARRRREVAQMARRLGLHILDDDCYSIGNHRDESYYSLMPERGWYVSSLSKALTPALRVGYVVPPKDYVADLERTAHFNSFGLSPALSDLALHFMEDPRMLTVAAKVRARVNELVRTAVNHLGAYDLSWNEDVPLLWLRLPEGWRTASFLHAAESSGVLLRSAEDFALRDSRAPHAVRIAVNGMVDQERFEAGILRLAELLDNPQEEIGV